MLTHWANIFRPDGLNTHGLGANSSHVLTVRAPMRSNGYVPGVAQSVRDTVVHSVWDDLPEAAGLIMARADYRKNNHRCGMIVGP